MFPNSSSCSQDTQTERSNFRPMEETEGPYVQGQFAIDMCHKAFLYAESSSYESTVEPVRTQLRQALAVIENVCKTSSTVWVNKQQCKKIKDSFSAIGESLKGWRWDRNLVCCEPSDAKSNRIQLLDELLTVLLKGESLLSYYKTWNFLGWMDRREAMFKDVIEELDVMKEKFHEGLTDVGHGEDCAFPMSVTSELERSPVSIVVRENSEMDEYHDRLISRVWKSEQTTGMDMDVLKLDITRQIAEGMCVVKRARDLIWGKTNSGEVCNLSTWKGVPYAEIAFETYLPILVLQALELDMINKLNRHPHIEGLSVGCNEQGSFVMDCMSGMNLKDLIESQRWRIPESAERIFVPLNYYILLQTGMVMPYLHSKGVVNRDLKSWNIFIVNQHPGPNRVDMKLVDFGSCQGYGAGIGSRPIRAPEMQRWETPDCHNLVDVFSFGFLCSEILTRQLPFIQTLPFVSLDELGSMWKSTLSKILHNEELLTCQKHLCENDWKEYGDVKSCLQKERLMSKVILDSTDDMGIVNNLEAFEAFAFKSVGSEEKEIVTCQNSAHSSIASLEGLVYLDGAHEHPRRTDYDIANVGTKLIREDPAEYARAMDDEAQPSEACSLQNGVGSCAPEATSNSSSLVQQVPQMLNDGEPARKRNRTRIWSDDEKLALVELTKEAPRLDVGPDWNYVSENLLEEYGYDRASISCQQQWGTLLQSYNAIQDHESNINACSEFNLECREIMDRILAANPLEEETRIFLMNADLPSSGSPLCGFQSSAIYMDHFSSPNYDEELDDEATDEESEIDIQSEDEGLSADSMATIEPQAESTADSHEPCNKTNSELYMKEQDSLHLDTNSKYAGRKRSGEDDLLARIAPFVNKQVEDALKPLISVLRRREENEQKHQEELLAIEEEKLALKRERMQFRHRALANFNELPACVPQTHKNQDLARAADSSDLAP